MGKEKCWRDESADTKGGDGGNPVSASVPLTILFFFPHHASHQDWPLLSVIKL